MKPPVRGIGPKAVLRWVIVLLLGAYALGAGAILAVVAAGKLGLRLLSGLAFDLLVLTTSWLSLAFWVVTVGGFAAAVVQLARRRKGAFWPWLAGYVAAVLVQAMQVAEARAAGQEAQAADAGVLVILALLGWGVWTVEHRRRPPQLPPGASRR